MRAERFNQGKPKLSYILDFGPALRGVAQVSEGGAAVHGRGNWRRGMPWTEVVDSLLRHLEAYQNGEDMAPEGTPHIDHVAWNALALATYWRTRREYDDRLDPPDQGEDAGGQSYMADGAALASALGLRPKAGCMGVHQAGAASTGGVADARSGGDVGETERYRHQGDVAVRGADPGGAKEGCAHCEEAASAADRGRTSEEDIPLSEDRDEHLHQARMTCQPKLAAKKVGVSLWGPPERSSDGAAGYDLRTTAQLEMPPGSRVLAPTGWAVEIPPGWVGLIRDRSGRAWKQGLTTRAGVIDSDYRGEVMVLLCNETDTHVTVPAGERIAQMVITHHLAWEFVEVAEFADTERGADGFGSTGDV